MYLQIICKSYTRKIQFSQNSRFQKMEKPNPKENVVLRKQRLNRLIVILPSSIKDVQPVCLCCLIECKYICFFFYIYYQFICWKSVAIRIKALWGPLFRVSVDLLPPSQSLARDALQLQPNRGCVLLYTTRHWDTTSQRPLSLPSPSRQAGHVYTVQHRTHHRTNLFWNKP